MIIYAGRTSCDHEISMLSSRDCRTVCYSKMSMLIYIYVILINIKHFPRSAIYISHMI